MNGEVVCKGPEYQTLQLPNNYRKSARIVTKNFIPELIQDQKEYVEFVN